MESAVTALIRNPALALLLALLLGGPALAVEAPPLDEGFAATGKRQLVLGVTDDQAAAFFRALP